MSKYCKLQLFMLLFPCGEWDGGIVVTLEEKAKNIFEWAYYQFGISKKIDRNPGILNMNVTRYSIYACHLGENVGFEKNGYGRPIIVLSSSIVFRKNTNVIIAPLSKNIKWAVTTDGKKRLRYSHHYVLYKSSYPLLEFDSCVQFEDIRVISKARLGKYICEVTDATDIKYIQKRIKEIFGI